MKPAMGEISKDSRHKRRHSWPPVRLTKKTRIAQHTEQNINDNPFAFFISPPTEQQPYLFDHVDAGIESTQHRSPRRALSKGRKPIRGWRKRAQAQKAVSRLKLWIRRMEKLYRNEPPVEIIEIAPPIMLIEHIGLPAELRGPIVNDEPQKPPQRPQRLRSHSARPRSWIEPQPDLWTVMEEEETEETSLGKSVPLLPTPGFD